MGCKFVNRESLLGDRGVAPTRPPSPEEDPATAAGATLPPLAWQTINERARGWGLKRPGDGVATSFLEVDFGRFFWPGGGVGLG